MPLRIIPERIKRPEHLIQSARTKECDVFDDGVARSHFPDEARKLGPEAGSVPGKPRAFPGSANVLAGESAADDVRANNSICTKPVARERLHVVIAGHLRPVFREDSAGERVDFTERHGAHSGALQAQREAADAAE